MESRSNHRHVDLDILTLRFDRRRYDGGTEMELIAFIERQQRQAGLPILGDARMSPPSPEKAVGPKVSRPTAAPRAQTPRAGRRQRVIEALIGGPVAIVVGAVGILTSLIAVGVFSQGGHTLFAAQSRDVLRECTSTLFKGLADTALAPIHAARALVLASA